MTTAEPDRLRELRQRLGAAQRVAPAPLPPAGWGFDAEGVLRHERTDFFHVLGAEDADGSRTVLLGQPEQALVGLVVARVAGVRHALLTARCEPGLHGGCQYSSTVQSTPSNYLRQHGGAATPHLELLVGGGSGARVLHHSTQYDWGQYYLSKTKRFLVVEVDELVETVEPNVWADERELVALLATPFAITSDLRAVLALLLAHDGGLEAAHDAAAALDAERVRTPVQPLRRCDLREVPGWDAGASAGPVAVRGVHVVSESREVAQWQQPLLAVAEPLTTTLPVRGEGAGRRFAIERRTARGLQGVELWHPAEATATEATVALRTSAEGGRFLQHEVVVGLAHRASPASAAKPMWVDLPELIALCSRSEATAVELRLALSLALVAGDEAA